MTVDYTVVVGESRRELHDLLVQRESIEARIGQVLIALRALARLVPERQREELFQYLATIPRRPLNLSDAILQLLRKPESSRGLTSNQIRDRLEESGYELAGYSQPLGSIFTTLQRLIKKGEVVRTDGKDATIVFKAK